MDFSKVAELTIPEGKITSISVNGKQVWSSGGQGWPIWVGDFQLLLSDNTYYLTGYRGTDTDIEIPSEYKGTPVTHIASGAFYNCTSLKSVVIPESITVIMESAFYGCTSLVEVVVPNSVQEIGFDAFGGCTSLSKLSIPFVGWRLNYAENFHFGYIFGATSYSNQETYIPSSLKTVNVTVLNGFADYVFYNCKSIELITLADGFQGMGDKAFYNCESLKRIEIPATCQYIGSNAFYGCSSLTIYCEASSKPDMWANDWNSSNRPVYWNQKF